MIYTIDCIAIEGEWVYRVTLWLGMSPYLGAKHYRRHGDAVRAAKATGAKPDPAAD